MAHKKSVPHGNGQENGHQLAHDGIFLGRRLLPEKPIGGKEAQTHRYRPTLSEREATKNLLSDFLGRFFHGSAESLVLGLVDARELDPEALRAIEARLASSGESPGGDIPKLPRLKGGKP